jgi:thioredoxin 1
MSLEDITDYDIDDKIGKGITLVDFYAVWCSPCKMLEPTLIELSRSDDVRDKINFVRMDVDENQVSTKKYEIMSIPTIIIFKDGKLVKKYVGGGISLADLRELVKQ